MIYLYLCVVIYFALLSILLLTLNQAVKVFSKWYEKYVTENIWSSLHKQSFKFFTPRDKPPRRPRRHKKSLNKSEKRSHKKYNRQGRRP